MRTIYGQSYSNPNSPTPTNSNTAANLYHFPDFLVCFADTYSATVVLINLPPTLTHNPTTLITTTVPTVSTLIEHSPPSLRDINNLALFCPSIFHSITHTSSSVVIHLFIYRFHVPINFIACSLYKLLSLLSSSHSITFFTTHNTQLTVTAYYYLLPVFLHSTMSRNFHCSVFNQNSNFFCGRLTTRCSTFQSSLTPEIRMVRVTAYDVPFITPLFVVHF